MADGNKASEAGTIQKADSIDDIRKLPLRERLEKLAEFEQRVKRQLEEASALIKEGKEQERREKVVEKVSVPEQENIEISDLFKRGGEELEAIISREAPEEPDPAQVRYELKLDYQILTQLDTAMERYKIQKTVLKVQERVNEIASKMTYANMGQDVADQLVATRSVLYTMKKSLGM